MGQADPASGILNRAARFAFRVKDSIRWRVVGQIVSDPIVVPYVSICARLVLRVRKPFIIGVTGSVGKTTTKEMIAAVLAHPEAAARIGRVGKSSKNLNDDMGLPLTALLYDDWLNENAYHKLASLSALPFRVARLVFGAQYPDVLVLEYGTHWQGHLHRLAALAPPKIAVVTTIGPAHLERLKTLAGVVQEKGALVRAVGSGGLVILGDDHSFVPQLERLSRAPVVKVTGRGMELSGNIARVIGRHLGIPDEAIDSALHNFKPPEGRLNRIEAGGFTIFDDTYNANPLSMRLGLDTLAESVQPGQRRIAILGAMGELGDESVRYHEEIGGYARSRADLLIGVGELAKHYAPNHWYPDSDACAREIRDLLQNGDCVLIKGSASVRMTKVVAKLRDQVAAQPA